MRLENYCRFSEKELLAYLSTKKNAVYKDDYVFINNNAKVLAVCHADVSPLIEPYRDFVSYKSVTGQSIVMSPALDDRLGCWLLLEMMKDIKMDILITTGEETGQSSAKKFHHDGDERYIWLVEFDRRGSDVVTYDFHNEEMLVEIEAAGFKMGLGSFSDICTMDKLGVAAFNVGIGYHQEHTRGCWASLGETFRQLKKFRKFYFRNCETEFLNEATSNWWERDYEWESPDDEWLYASGNKERDERLRIVDKKEREERLRAIKSDEEYLSRFSLGNTYKSGYRTNYSCKYANKNKGLLKVGLI